MALVRLGKSVDVPAGRGKLFTANGKKLAVFNMGGKFYCIDGICSHVGGPLWDGPVTDNIVACPWHGSEFDVRTGKVCKGPAKRDQIAYKITEKNGELFVAL